MLNRLLSLVVLLFSFHYGFSQINTGSPTVPFGSNASYEFGLMPTNLPSGGTYGTSTDAAEAWEEFKAGWIVDCGTNAARVRFDSQSETVSEGIAYAMLLSVYAADQSTFNKLWQFYKNHRNGNGVMNWKISGCNTAIGFNGATDAEVDASMALIVADFQWGSNGTVHNYKDDAVALINAMKDFEVNTKNFTFENGDAWKPVSGQTGLGCRNPSYQAPGYARVYEQFMNENGEDGSFWNSVAVGTEALLKNNSDQTSAGLASNWSNTSGSADGGCNGSGTSAFSFGYDACRAPWRQGVDYLWHGSAAVGMQGIVNNQVSFWIGNGGAGSVSGGDSRSQNGSGSGDHNGAFLGMIGAQSLAASTSNTNQNFVNDMYEENVSVNPNGYFVRILRCLGLFVQTGNFWNPYTVGSAPSTLSISFTLPSSNSFSEGETVNFEVNASDSQGSISKVEFFSGTNLLATENSAPYEYSTNDLPAGSNTITVIATNNNGETISETITIEILGTIPGTSTAPTIDGQIDAVWDLSTSKTLENIIAGTVSSSNDLSTDYRVLWDEDYLYILVEVTDDSKQNNSTDVFQDDGVEIFLDINNDNPTSPGTNDFQFQIGYNDDDAIEAWNNNANAIEFSQSDVSNGYVIEARFRWSDIGENNPSVGDLLGIDVEVNDDDTGTTTRDAKIAWAATEDNAWQNPSLLGTLILGEIIDNGCTPPSSASITNSGSSASFCEGESFTLIANSVNGHLYQWFRNGNSITDAELNNNSIEVSDAGNYTVRIADEDINDNECYLESDGFTLTENELPTAGINTSNSSFDYCEGENGAFVEAVDAGNGATYRWIKTGGGTVTGREVTLDEGSYILEVTSNGCTLNANAITITENALPTAAINTNNSSFEYCSDENGASVRAINAGNEATYSWVKEGGEIVTGRIVTLDEGEYTLEVTLNGCTTSENSISISENQAPIASVNTTGDLEYCEGEDGVIVQAGNAGNGASYRWVNQGGTETTGRTVTLDEGNYTLEVTLNECTTTEDGIEIIENELPLASMTSSVSLEYCEGEEGTTVEAVEAGNGASYRWISSSGSVTSGQTAILNEGVYTLEVTSDECVSNSDAFTISEQALPTAAIDNSSSQFSYCPDETNSVVVIAEDAGSGAIYEWRDENNEIITGQIVNLEAGTYTLEVTRNGCTSNSSLFNITEVCICEAPELATINNTINQYCEGSSLELTANTISGSLYQWFRNGEAISNGLINDNTFTISEPGTYTVRIADRDLNDQSCYIESSDFTVTESALPTAIVLTQDLEYCSDDISGITVEAENAGLGVTYEWIKEGGTTSISGRTALLDEGVYTLEVTNNSCISSTEIEIEENCPCIAPSEAVITNSNLEFCENETLTLTANLSSGHIYQWFRNGEALPTTGLEANTLELSQDGVYSVRIADQHLDDESCYVESNEVNVIENELPEAALDLEVSDLVYCPDSVENVSVTAIDAGTGAEYTWIEEGEANLTGQTISLDVGVYTLEVTNNGCINSLSIFEVTENCGPELGTISVEFVDLEKTIFEEGELVEFEVIATTTVGSISTVSFFDENNELLQLERQAPYTFNTSDLSIGTHIITAVVENSNGVIEETSITVEITFGADSEVVFKTTQSPIIDGESDPIWDFVDARTLENTLVGEFDDAEDLSSTFKAIWDDEFYYVLIDVVDESLRNNSENPWEDDGIEVFVDIDNDKDEVYGLNDFQFYFGYDEAQGGEFKQNSVEGILFEQTETVEGYRVELAIPWTLLQNDDPSVGEEVGFDVAVNDDDIGSDGRDAKIAWASPDDNSWQNPSLFGTIILGPEFETCLAPNTAEIDNSNNTFCEGESVMLRANLVEGYIYQWFQNGNPLSNGIINDNTLSIDTEGTYSVIIADGDLTNDICFLESGELLVEEISLPTVSISSASLEYCEGENGISLGTSSITGATYEWEGPVNSMSNILTGATEGIYLVSINVDGCITESESVEVIEKPLPEASISSTTLEYCEGEGGVNLEAGEVIGATYEWTGSISTTTRTLNNVSQGSYIVEVSLNGCMTTSEAVAVSEIALPEIEITTQNLTYCEGETGTELIATNINEAFYEWSGPVTNSTTNSLNGATEGTYAVSIITVEGCEASSSSVEVFETENPQASIITSGVDLTYCEGGAGITLQAINSPQVTFEWVGPVSSSTTNTLSNATAGEYTVIVTRNGCPTTSSPVTITENPLPTGTVIITGSEEVCSGEEMTYQVTGGNDVESYLWSVQQNSLLGRNEGASNQIIFTESDIITITLENECGTGTRTNFSVEVTNSVIPEVAIQGPEEICEGGSATYTTTVQNVGNNPVFVWMLNGAVVEGENQSILFVEEGFQTDLIMVEVTSNASCVAAGEETVSSTYQVQARISPVIEEIVGEADICLDFGTTAAKYSVPLNEGSSYFWSVVNGIILEGEGTNEITIEFSENNPGTSISVVEIGGQCVSEPETKLISFDCLTGINDNVGARLDVYPNPFNDYINVEGFDTYKVMDINGKEVLSGDLDRNIINTENLPEAVYILELQNQQVTEILRVSKIY